MFRYFRVAVLDCAAMRDSFLLDPGLVFLNHGSFGACPREVLAEQRRWQDGHICLFLRQHWQHRASGK